MIASSCLTPKLFARTFVYGLVNRPVFNTFAVGLPLLIIVLLHGLKAGVITAAIIAAVASVFYGLISTILYLTYRNRERTMTVSYKVDENAIRISYGDRLSAHTHTRILRKENASRAWVFGRGIYVRHKALTYCLIVPDEKRTRFIQAMKKAGWFALAKPSFTERFMTITKQAGAVAAIGLFITFAFPGAPKATPAVSGQTPAMTIKNEDIFKVVNDRRIERQKAPLLYDGKLAASAARSCADMTKHKFFGSTNPLTGHKGYEYIREYYADSWVVEVALPITENFTVEQVVSRWVDNSGANIAVLDQNYRIGAVASCEYTAGNQFTKIIVLHLAS